MDYRRIYWALFVGIGLLFGIRYLPVVLAGGRGLGELAAVAGAVVLAAAGLFGLARPERAGGPEEPNLLFAIVLFAFLLELAAAVLGL
ncbi:hypothetical protein [Halorarius halobius]|uniref:hypothetical protein n=1 Tax=Halorarius halobius TaxID=2962671 RepID=UPI0020CCDA58|nr:hypothetical protein [Halorarius halobius]